VTVFFSGSRYLGLGTYGVTRRDGTTVTVTRLPLPAGGPLLGYHRRLVGERLDLVAARHLKDPTAFWQLCDANDSVSPDALGAAPLVGVAAKRS
jgi:hypothetical protein